jgi:hypothetical protein
MKLLIIALLFVNINLFAQKSITFKCTSTNFYELSGDTWIKKDTSLFYDREFTLLDDRILFKYSDEYTISFYIDVKSCDDESEIYFCKDIEFYPMIFEFYDKEVVLYYFFDKITHKFEKMEKLTINTIIK